MRTEYSVRSNVQSGTNSLASSVVLVCRPRTNDAPTATRRQFFDALEKELPASLNQLTRKGHIAPTDLAQAAIGPGMQIYSRYSRVETISGEVVSVREALVAINRAIADYDERQEGDFDSETRFCLDWLKQHGYGEGAYGEAETLARAKNVAIGKLQDVDGLLIAGGGRVKLLPIDAFSDNEQLTLGNTTAWKGCFRMAYHLSREDGKGVSGAAAVGREMDGSVESVERLARILYNHYDRKGVSQNAVIFNNLVTEWGNIRSAMENEEQLSIPI
jgi:putative DNA methylase